MRVLFIALVVAACVPRIDTSDLQRCNADDPLVDCCSDSDQCLAYFGETFPFCVEPGKATGQCVECTVNEHCDLDSYCEADDPEAPPYCAPLPVDGE